MVEQDKVIKQLKRRKMDGAVESKNNTAKSLQGTDTESQKADPWYHAKSICQRVQFSAQ